MQVRILKETEYAPKPTDNFRCIGQLQKRASRIVKECDVDKVDANGKVIETIHTTRTICGPMVDYFPIGSTPDLDDETAKAFVAAGVAEFFDAPHVQIVDAKTILEMATP